MRYLFLLLTACAGGGDIPTTYTGTSAALYFSAAVPAFEDVEETVVAEINGSDVALDFALCSLIGTDYSYGAQSERAFVTPDLDASDCDFDAEGTAIDVTLDDVLINWDSEELSVLASGTANAGGDDFMITLTFDGVVDE